MFVITPSPLALRETKDLLIGAGTLRSLFHLLLCFSLPAFKSAGQASFGPSQRKQGIF